MAASETRTNRQARINWWRAQFQRQQNANLSVTEFCRQIGVSITTFYYWKKRVDEVLPDARGLAPGVGHSRHVTTAANFVPISIIEPDADTELEIELTNNCMVRVKGAVDPLLLQAAITAAGQLNGSRQGAN